jgi:glutamate-1-semialdehyde 2,1-aminomutase
MESIMCKTAVILPRPEYLQQVRELCDQHGVVLIFDEVITGFRVGLRGAQGYLGVTPDLAVFAKAMANGYPISCIAGRRDLMQQFGTNAVVHGGTFNSNTVSCAAAMATLRHLKANADNLYGRTKAIGSKLMDGLRAIAQEQRAPLIVQGLPSAFHTTFGHVDAITDYRSHQQCMLEAQAQFVDELLREGIRVTGRATWFLSAAHSEADIDRTLLAASAAMSRVNFETPVAGS